MEAILRYFLAFAEVMLLDESSSYRIPDAMTDEDAGGFLVTHQTSYFALVHRAQLQPEEVLLVHGGAGGVGTTAIQLGKILGATVIATAGSEEKLEICRQCGADHVINYDSTGATTSSTTPDSFGKRRTGSMPFTNVDA